MFIALVDYFQYTYRSNSVEFYFPAISTSVLVLAALGLVGQRLRSVTLVPSLGFASLTLP